MKPDFDEIVGSEGTPEELDELRHVHELLLSATPPPTLDRGRRLPRVRTWLPRRWAIGLAAAASVAAGVGVGFVAGQNSGFQTGFIRPMHGVGSAAAATAVIKVGNEDASGNRPLVMDVRSLPTLSKGMYELDLTRKGRPVVACGIFQTGPNGAATVTMNAPADLAEYDGWIVTADVPGAPSHVLLST